MIPYDRSGPASIEIDARRTGLLDDLGHVSRTKRTPSRLKKHPDLAHVRVRKRGNLLILESGSKEAPIPHARLRRTEIGTWALEMPYRSRWEPTPYQDEAAARSARKSLDRRDPHLRSCPGQ